MPAASLFLPAFDDTDSLGSTPRRVVYPPGSTNWEAELKLTTFSSLIFFRDFLSVSSFPDSRFLAGNREAELKPTTLFTPSFP